MKIKIYALVSKEQQQLVENILKRSGMFGDHTIEVTFEPKQNDKIELLERCAQCSYGSIAGCSGIYTLKKSWGLFVKLPTDEFVLSGVCLTSCFASGELPIMPEDGWPESF